MIGSENYVSEHRATDGSGSSAASQASRAQAPANNRGTIPKSILKPAVQNQNKVKPAAESTGIIQATQSLTASLFQSLVTIATNEPQIPPLPQDEAEEDESREVFQPKELLGGHLMVKQSSDSVGEDKVGGGSQNDTHHSQNQNSDDSSDNELTFLGYVKRFSETSPPPSRPVLPFNSPTSGYASSSEVKPASSAVNTSSAIRTVSFQEPLKSPSEITKQKNVSKSTHESSKLSFSKTPEINSDDEGSLSRHEDYDIITTYFYRTQSQLVKRKWPFLQKSAVKHLVDTKWLEMEWEDIEHWAKESAQHLNDEDYIEPDLFEDLDLADPRSKASSSGAVDKGKAKAQ
ncbi:hypothetical protein ABW19_dt0205210 [Dactylella cylindrospora]|nr:hypothetical protein ABW19_dt0205210 [Dactylella cylindrospora]